MFARGSIFKYMSGFSIVNQLIIVFGVAGLCFTMVEA
jgi:low affinity Fe/Cu permease